MFGVAIAWGSLKLGIAWAGTTATVPNNPLNLLLQLAAGRIPWPREATYSAGIIAAAVVLLAVAVAVLATRVRRRRTRVDPAAKHLGRGRDIEPTSRTAVTATAARLGVIADAPGVFLGRTVASGADVAGVQPAPVRTPRRHPLQPVPRRRWQRRPLVTALTFAVVKSRRGLRHHLPRWPPPRPDDRRPRRGANVCRWKDLPDL
ncbi:hypothetical protein [Kribbella steppae]|uniref:hypothetical protein n=1 Tax=Kribbella steppae TaxID=2512223 RepID=UPI0018EE64D5|nr:hypothetical protein [Kribbella steppae]